MFIKKFSEQNEIIAGDECILRELLNGDIEDVACRYSIAHCRVQIGKHTTRHALKTTEVYYLISGKGRMHINDEIAEVNPTDTIYIPPHAIQWIENIGNEELVFLAIVDPAWKVADEIILSDNTAS